MFKSSWEKKEVLKWVIPVSVIFALLTMLGIFSQNMMNQLILNGSPDVLQLFYVPGIPVFVSYGLVYLAVPIILMFLDGLTRPDQNGLKRNPALILFYLVLTVGLFVVYYHISKGLEKRTGRDFLVWFIVFSVFSGIDMVINQALIYDDIKLTDSTQVPVNT